MSVLTFLSVTVVVGITAGGICGVGYSCFLHKMISITKAECPKKHWWACSLTSQLVFWGAVLGAIVGVIIGVSPLI